MVQLTREHWTEILRRVERENPGLSPLSHKFKIIFAKACERIELPAKQVQEAMLNFGHYLTRRPQGIPFDWKLVWCKSFLCPKYFNPQAPLEYVLIIPNMQRGHLPYITHHSAEGFADRAWFTEVIPQLETILKDPTIGRPFSEQFNEAVNAMFGHKMTTGQVAALNLFFEKFVPGLEGICTTCYRVSLPKSGSGECWRHREEPKYEVRLSAAKPNGREGQRYEYVSHTELDENDDPSYAFWDKEMQQMGLDPNMKQKNTHIPWETYDFNKFSFNMPQCQCRK